MHIYDLPCLNFYQIYTIFQKKCLIQENFLFKCEHCEKIQLYIEKLETEVNNMHVIILGGLCFWTKVAQSMTFQDIVQSCFVTILTT